VLAWAERAFGSGYSPVGRHFLLDKEEETSCRTTGERPVAAATVYTVRNDAGRKRHFTVDGETITEHPDMETGIGAMLLEQHPTMRIEVRGQMVAPHRYSLCWAGCELYNPRSAEQLAAGRKGRQHAKEVREAKKFAEENPLWEWAERANGEEERGR
jgi:hypothetical protein